MSRKGVLVFGLWVFVGLTFSGPLMAQEDVTDPFAVSDEIAEATEEDMRLDVVLDLERPSNTDILILRNGDKLTGTVLNDSFSIRTSYAQLRFNNRMIAGIDLEGGASNIESIITVNNNRFSGFIDDSVFVFKLQDGPQIQVRREKVVKVVFRVREAERQGIPQRQFVQLKNGDYFSGVILNDRITILTTYAEIPLDLKTVRSIRLIGGESPLTTVLLLNGDILQGVLQTEDIEFELDVGPKIEVYQDRMDIIYCEHGYIPDSLQMQTTWTPRQGSTRNVAIPGTNIIFEMVPIPGGSFLMGSPAGEAGRQDTEGPQRRVNMKPFWLGIYEVTQAQWEAVMGSNPSNWKGANLPVENVSWNDCQEFIRKLNEKVPGGNFRLPSEAEWEYACRAGSITRYYFGDSESELGNYAWFVSNSNQRTNPVGQKRPNVWGLFDMHGNVWEWCEDWFHDNYQGAPTDGSARVSPTSSTRVLRGGSWGYDPHYCRSASRDGNTPDYRFDDRGFRLARTP